MDSKLTNFETIEESVRHLKLASRTLHISSRACANQDIVTGRWVCLADIFCAVFWLVDFLSFLIDSTNGEESPVRLATSRMGEVYKECGVATNSLKSFSDRVQEELTVFFSKVFFDKNFI